MKNVFFIVPALLTLSIAAFSQGVKISATPGAPDPAAYLEIESVTGGLLPPRMTSDQRDALPAPVPAGLRIFNTDTGCENFYNGTSWKQVCGDCIFGNPVASANGPVCEGETIQLFASTIPDVLYSWSGPDGFFSSLQNPELSGAQLSSSGMYFVSASKDGCVSSATGVFVQVNEAPVGGTTTPSLSSVCAGASVTVSVSGHVGSIAWEQSGNNVSWEPVSGGSGASSDTYSTPALSQSTYYRAVLSNGTCTSSESTVSLITVTSPSATGGTLTTSGGYTIHTFNSSGTFTPNSCLTSVELLVVAGGGGGAGRHGGGGGGGGVIYYGAESPAHGASYAVTPSVPVSVVVGNGGAGGNDPGGYPGSSTSTSGGNSSFGSVVATGGGKGATYNEAGIGGSGGGAGGYNGMAGAVNTNIGLGVSGQGNNGGTGVGTSSPFSFPGGGGGGAGSVGGNASGTIAGNGGNGRAYSISGSSQSYGGGGGGAPYHVGTPGTGGTGGGGAGKLGTNGDAGLPNTGGGGGGSSEFLLGGNGGSGVVIVRYLNGM